MVCSTHSRQSPTTVAGRLDQQFAGFEPPTANFIYCPNQFFDLCLPNYSRNVSRLVGCLLYKTLGWLDKNGEPIEQNISLSYRDIITDAGISRGAIRTAIDQAISAGFIACTQQGRRRAQGEAGQTARYALRWTTDSEYVTDAKTFHGFYAGDGHRTPIPNAFFDRVLPTERLAVIKVVGTVLRHTVGYQNQFGGRRSQAPLSYSYIQRYANLRGRANLSSAVRHATDVGYIRCVEKGCVAPSSTKRKPATYAVKWLEEAQSGPIGSKKKPVDSERFRNGTSNGSERKPAERFKKGTKEKTVTNDTLKQQDMPPAVAAENFQSYLLLIDAGFDERTAVELSQSRGFEEIQRQINWLKQRNPSENPLGMVRRAIEENWAKPPTVTASEKEQAARKRAKQQQAEQAVEDARAAEQKRHRRERRQALLSRWQTLTIAERQEHHRSAIQNAASDTLRRRLRSHVHLDAPPIETLDAMALNLAVAIGESS